MVEALREYSTGVSRGPDEPVCTEERVIKFAGVNTPGEQQIDDSVEIGGTKSRDLNDPLANGCRSHEGV